MSLFRRVPPALCVLALTSACGPRAAIVPPPAVVQPDSSRAAPPLWDAWTRHSATPLRTEAGVVVVEFPFTELQVLPTDSADVWVRCSLCTPPCEGWAPRNALVFTPPATPADVATGPLGDFVLAVRAAAQRQDLLALYAVMDPGFTYTFTVEGSRQEALAAWRAERFQTLARLPDLLAAGVFPYPGSRPNDGALWVAPRAFAESLHFRDLRTGFQRIDGRWRWMFLVRRN